jgi:ribose-phosphate pyrophosphokinase
VKPVVLALPGNEALARDLAESLAAELGECVVRRFPDGESHVRVASDVAGRPAVLACTLSRPDEQAMPLFFLAATAKDLGATSVGLVAPYLAYMRQDCRFRPGEGITSVYFARLISASFDWLVTVDPHLHRHHSLAEIYAIPATAVQAAPAIAAWLATQVASPLLVGPDRESAQWVAAVGDRAAVPHIVLEKVRRGDRKVEISVPDVEQWRAHTPVVIDDMISTGRTMIETVGHLKRAGLPPPVCIGVHAVFVDGAYEDLRSAGVARVLTCNTIPHPSNEIDVGDLLAAAVERLLV